MEVPLNVRERVHKPCSAERAWSATGVPFMRWVTGTRYCGPGTDIAAMDRLGGPRNRLDCLCRAHDVEYDAISTRVRKGELTAGAAQRLTLASDKRLVTRIRDLMRMGDPQVSAELLAVVIWCMRVKVLYEELRKCGNDCASCCTIM